MNLKCCCVSLHNFFCEYSSPKMLVVRSINLGVIYHTLQGLVILYILCYVFLSGGYQDTDTILSSVTTKVKGIALTNTTELGERIWDVTDYIIPPQEDGSFFLMTNMIITPNQTQSKCAEYPNPESICTSHMNCTKGFVHARGSGVQTGRCVQYSDSQKTCEVLAWCPVEKRVEPPNPPVLADAENFTILIKNNIQYPNFNFSKGNFPAHINSSYLSHCLFNQKTDPECPIFRVKDIVEEAQEDFQTMAVLGGVIAVQIQWNCNLDVARNLCVPKYSFRRLDKKEPESSEAPVNNFRFAKYYKNSDGKEIRTLIKGYGIRFDVMVFGQARKFNIFTMILHVGALLSFLKVVDYICDCIAPSHIKKHMYTYINEYGDISDEAPLAMEGMNRL